MTDLDRQIAELKGFSIIHEKELMGTKFEFATNSEGKGLKSVGGEWWSTDIAKAFELVDEVCIDQDNKKGARFHLIQWEAKTGIAAHWEARIEPYWIDGEYTLTQVGNRFDGRGQTRPEAICRAYIALREREGKKC